MSSTNKHTLQVQQLFVRHQSALKAFVLGMWPDFAEADDILQEVFLVITRKAHQFDLETNFLSWARTIARYEVLNARKKKSRFSLNPDVIDALEAACPEDFADDRRLKALDACLEELAPKAREIMQLRYLHEHGPSEIGRLLSRSVNSINVALSRSRVALRECIDRQLETPPQTS